jgi:hypothetical protein
MYSIQNVPTGQDLQVQISAAPSAFTSAVSAVMPPTATNPNGPIKIPGGNCNKVAPVVPSPSVLSSNWWTCGIYAYNVNFVLQPSGSNRLMNGAGNSGLLSSQPQPTKNPGPAGMLSSNSITAVQSQGSSVLIQGDGRPQQQVQAKASAIQGNKQSTQPGLASQKPLTNADVVKMVRNGIPESVIVSSVQSAGKNFNFGPDGCRALKQARVSPNVLIAMGEGSVQACAASAIGGAGGKVADDLNPQPYPPGRKPMDPALKTKFGPAKAGTVVKNPLANRVNSATIAVLQKQRSAADLETSQMRLSVSPATQGGLTDGTSQLMSANGTGGTAAISQSASATALSNAGSSSGTTGPSKISTAVTRLNVDTTAITCSNDPTFRILKVSGSGSPATFTPIAQYNLYTITGCSFGNPGASDKVYIYGTGTFQANFVINFWSDNSIVVALDPTITGHPDLNNLSLVVQRGDGQQSQKQGFSFYAARKIVPLKMIPSSWATLPTLTYSDKTMAPQYSSPSSSSGQTGTAFVSRSFDGAKFDPTGQSDYYDFSQLAPGWTTDSFQVTTYPQSCLFVITYKQDFGAWNWTWDQNNPNNIRISLSDTTCSGLLPNAPWVNYQNLTGSYYLLQVWVIGPAGIDPITNQPVS